MPELVVGSWFGSWAVRWVLSVAHRRLQSREAEVISESADACGVPIWCMVHHTRCMARAGVVCEGVVVGCGCGRECGRRRGFKCGCVRS